MVEPPRTGCGWICSKHVLDEDKASGKSQFLGLTRASKSSHFVVYPWTHSPAPPNFESQLKSHIWQKKHNSVFNIFLHQDLATSSMSRKEDFVKLVQLHGLTRSSSLQIWEQKGGESKGGGDEGKTHYTSR